MSNDNSNPTSLSDVIRYRRSIRRYLPKPVEDEKVRQVIEAGNQAPSACNKQGWRFRLLTDPEQAEIVRLGAADFIGQAPTVILVLHPLSTDGYSDGIQSSAACIQNMLLKCTELGLGACWVCHLPPKWRLRRLFKLPWHYDIVACVALGYPKKPPKAMKRKHEVDDLFELEPMSLTLREIVKYFYMRQPLRPAFIERIFTKRFDN